MRTSNKILLATASGPVIIVLLLFLSLRIMLGGPHTTEDAVALNMPDIRQDYSIGVFDAIQAKGVWDLEIVREENRQVRVNAPESALPHIIVETRGRTLYLDATGKPDHIQGYPKAFITLPILKGIDLKGVVNLDFEGFRSDSIDIRTHGCNLVKGIDNIIGRLHLDGEGLSKIDLSASPSIHADLTFEGAYKVELLMTGGELTGEIKGLGKVSYDGSVSEQTIEIDGPGRVVGP